MRKNRVAAADLVEKGNRLALQQEQPGIMLVFDDGFDHLLEPLDDFFFPRRG